MKKDGSSTPAAPGLKNKNTFSNMDAFLIKKSLLVKRNNLVRQHCFLRGPKNLKLVFTLQAFLKCNARY